jgi:hypothetical protein
MLAKILGFASIVLTRNIMLCHRYFLAEVLVVSDTKLSQ